MSEGKKRVAEQYVQYGPFFSGMGGMDEICR